MMCQIGQGEVDMMLPDVVVVVVLVGAVAVAGPAILTHLVVWQKLEA